MNVRRRSGFTLAELSIVIVVMGVLATIITAIYGGYQKQYRDNVRKSNLTTLASAFKSYATWQGSFVESGSGCGYGGNGDGWLDATSSDSASYSANSIAKCLVNAGYLKTVTEVTDPSGCKLNSGGACGSGNPTKAYMKATCTVGGIKTVYLMAYLESQPANNATIDALCGKNWGTTYGMNYYVQVQ